MNKQFTREQVYNATLKYFNGDELATNVWIDKYCLRNKNIYYELTPDDMHHRLAKEFARIEAKYENPLSEEEIYNLLKNFKYIIPQGSPMKGVGNPFALTSISNCFVIGGQPDSYGGILNADEEQSQLMKRRGGVGQDLSHLRPSGADANGEPLGPNAGMPLYMERYSNSTREVQQDGRRGALMLSVSCKHPDAEKFIDKKMTEGSVTGANVSVKITRDFMEALNKENYFHQIFPTQYSLDDVYEDNFEFELDKLYKGKIINGQQTYFKVVDPKKIWKKLIHNAWASAEPGCLFWDKIIEESPARGYGEAWKEVSTNPCGEIPLPPYDSCRLLVVNLLNFVKNAYQEDSYVDEDLLIDTIKKAQRLMDDIVDLEIEKIDAIITNIKSKPLPSKYQEVELNLWEKIKATAVQGRRTGLGITAEGDMLAALGFQYGTRKATILTTQIHKLIASASYESSIILAKERGAFPLWVADKDASSEFVTRIMSIENDYISDGIFDTYMHTGRRNIANLTIAPTGSVSILSQTTSGIEPLFAPWYFRKKKITVEKHWDYIDEVGDKWVEFPVFHEQFITWYSVYMDLSREDALEQLSSISKERLQKFFEISPYYKATAQDVDYVEKARMQGSVQKWVDHSISVTVNMPEDVTEDVVAQVYKVAYESGCKGITVYRDNSRGNVLSTSSVKDKPEDDFEYSHAAKRPDSLECDVFFKTKAGEDFIILVGKLKDKPYEIFCLPNVDEIHIPKKVKKGFIIKEKRGDYTFQSEDGFIIVNNISSLMIESEQNSTRNFSAMLRHRMDPKFIIDMISKYASISSFHKVIGKVLKTYIEEDNSLNPCPQEGCEGEMQMTEGCMRCDTCGYAACG